MKQNWAEIIRQAGIRSDATKRTISRYTMRHHRPLKPPVTATLFLMAIIIALLSAAGCSGLRQDVADANAVFVQANEAVTTLRADIAEAEATEATAKADAVLGDIQGTINTVGTQLEVLDARLEAAENVPDVLDAVGATAKDTGLPYSGAVALGLGLIASLLRNVQNKQTLKRVVKSVAPVMDNMTPEGSAIVKAIQDASGVAGAVDVARGKRTGMPI